jgi:hypothetical protein
MFIETDLPCKVLPMSRQGAGFASFCFGTQTINRLKGREAVIGVVKINLSAHGTDDFSIFEIPAQQRGNPARGMSSPLLKQLSHKIFEVYHRSMTDVTKGQLQQVRVEHLA